MQRMVPSPADSGFFAIFDRSRNPMLLADDDRHYVRVNQAACDLVGYAQDELLRLRIDDLSVPGMKDSMDDVWAAFLQQGGSIGVFPILRADGSEVLVEFNATANVQPGLHLSIFIDPVEAGDPAGLDADATGGPLMQEPVDAVRQQSGTLLTDDERTVMSLLALGQTWHEIADDMEIDLATVRSLTESAMGKLGARTRAHAVSVAMRVGEITPGRAD